MEREHENKHLGGMRNVWIISGAMAILALCYTMLVPFLPVYLLELGVENDRVALWSGAVFGITFFIAGVMAPIWGKIADARGKKMMAMRAGFAIALSYIIIGLVMDPWQLLLGRAFQGFANGFYPAAMTMVSLSVSEDKVGKALGIFQTALILGNIIGPFLGGTVESFVGMRPVFYIAGGAVCFATLLVVFFVKEPNMAMVEAKNSGKAEEIANTNIDQTISFENNTASGVVKKQSSTSIFDDFKAVKKQSVLVQLLWIFFFMQCAIMMLQPILALYIGHVQGTMESAAIVAGSILSIGGLAGAATTNLWVRLGQRKGYFRTISFCLLGTGVALLLQSLPLGIWWFGALQILVGSFIVGVNPSLSAAVTLNTNPAFRGRMFGMTTTAQQFGSMVGPVFASIVSTYIGFSYVFGFTGVLMLYLAWKNSYLSKAHD